MNKEVKNFAMRGLRRASYKWPPRDAALKRAKRSHGIYECNLCKKETRRRDVQLDHVNPVIPVTGFDSFDGVIERLFCDEGGFQVVCTACHLLKTNLETEERVHERKVRKRKI